ncbi:MULTISPECIES: MFS transporter [unclassified Corynebacterium]|uniref:MFS transporter n=1 Tax=unclassified Corynebacterium TaxID=2624378 RepID=UPI0029CA70F4|nr:MULTISPECIES: MFS transporter [unclassified Corynebacterium]WPF66035.1 MFS transporter [Corynebacterium sp. 22KM0430]WPF68528.1 MFS transporter [Corynebacterium sp. 21KM1197]
MTKSTQGKPNVLLAAILLAVVIVPMGVSGTGVALPYIASDLGSHPAQLQWVVNGFNLTFAVFSLVAGSISDHLGRKRGLLLGSLIFGLSSILSALAPNLIVLDIARGIAGIGAAIIFACSGALLAVTFSGAASARAFALFGTAAGVGLGLGPTVSSLAIAVTGWKGIFWFSTVAIGISIILALASNIRDTSTTSQSKVDYPGAVTFAASLSLIITGIAQSNTWGWASPGTVTLICLGIALFAAFILIEKKAANPLLDLSLLKSPRLVGLLSVPVAGAIGFVTLLTYYPTFLTTVWGLSSQKLGIAMLIMTIPVVIGPLIAGKLYNKGVSAKIILSSSIVFFALGAALLTLQDTTPNIPSLVIPFLIIGLGFGLGVGLVNGQAIGSVPEEKSGMVSGLVSTVRLGSEAIVVAVFAGILSTSVGTGVKKILPDNIPEADKKEIINKVVSGEIGGIHTPDIAINSLQAAFSQGLTPILWTLAAISLMLSIAVAALLSNRNTEAKATEG